MKLNQLLESQNFRKLILHVIDTLDDLGLELKQDSMKVKSDRFMFQAGGFKFTVKDDGQFMGGITSLNINDITDRMHILSGSITIIEPNIKDMSYKKFKAYRAELDKLSIGPHGMHAAGKFLPLMKLINDVYRYQQSGASCIEAIIGI